MQVFLTFNTILIKKDLLTKIILGYSIHFYLEQKNVNCLLVLENGIQTTFNYKKYFSIKVR